MKHWKETSSIVDRIAALARESRTAALATVIHVDGSAYRREGAKLLVADDGRTVGNVSGGCLEQDVREAAQLVAASGIAQLRSYCSAPGTDAPWSIGLGCDGRVELLIEPVEHDWTHVRAAMDQCVPFAVCSLVQEGAPSPRLVVTHDCCTGTLGDAELDCAARQLSRSLLGDGSSRCHMIADRRVFIDVFAPPPRLLIVGAGEDALPLARFASEAGFRVMVADRRPGLLDVRRFPEGVQLVRSSMHVEGEMRVCKFDFVGAESSSTRLRPIVGSGDFAVLMSHDFDDDLAALRHLLQTPVRYVGLLGPPQRTERMLAAVGESVRDPRVFGPIGLDLGADGAEQVALSIVAELLAVRVGRSAVSLRDRASRRQPMRVAAGANGGDG